MCALTLLWNTPSATSITWNHQRRLRVGNATSNSTESPTPVPSVAPGGNATNTTTPTSAPSVQVKNLTQTPTAAPSVEVKNFTQSPTLVPTKATNAPTTQPVGSLPTKAPTRAYTTSPTMAPHGKNGTDNGGDHHHHKKGPTIAKLIAKTLGWFVFIFLSGLVFAAGVSHKERIFYLLKECWYHIRQSGFTRWLARFFRRGGGRSDNSLSEVVFDSSDADGMSEALLLRDGL